MTYKTVFVLSAILSLSLITPVGSFAQDATQGATQLRDSVKQKVTEELTQIKKVLTKKGFIGTVTSYSDGVITLTNLKNQTRTITITADTTIKLISNKEGTPADIKVNDFVIAMGDADAQNNMTLKRILVLSKPNEDRREFYSGTITKASISSITIKTATEERVLKINSATKYTPKGTDSGDLEANAKVLVVTIPSSTGTDRTATRIHVMP